ncbi:hypothetical protein [Streptomyces agglomeratus]|uniref:hypothetical protein n=1 Tax=Streptomyces agglomeratus TaxID=285458 RepID=UPI000854BC25|nr:hypothetical protein [Streptomyces agglomeratus]OEJ52969.1 hypothetical protein BGK72_21505 [Streptomyces agglomeratus]
MVESEECSRSAGGSHNEEPGAPRGVPKARNPAPGLPEPPEGLPALLATLGEYLEHHPPEDVAVLLRAELERREFRAYASGWRDAADQYEPALEQARRIAQTRRLRLVGRTPGQAAVIPFPQDSPSEGSAEPPPSGTEEPTPSHRSTDRGPAKAGDDSPQAADPAAPAPSPGSGLVAKNRNSRAPTIPRLTTHRPGRRDRP